jgi:hypothetical protein
VAEQQSLQKDISNFWNDLFVIGSQRGEWTFHAFLSKRQLDLLPTTEQ